MWGGVLALKQNEEPTQLLPTHSLIENPESLKMNPKLKEMRRRFCFQLFRNLKFKKLNEWKMVLIPQTFLLIIFWFVGQGIVVKHVFFSSPCPYPQRHSIYNPSIHGLDPVHNTPMEYDVPSLLFFFSNSENKEIFVGAFDYQMEKWR